MKITNTKQVENALLEIAEIEAQVAQAKGQCDEQIADAKRTFTEFAQAQDGKVAKIVDALREYSDENRDEIYTDGKKSRDYINGTIGYRQSPDSIEVSERTADLLIGMGFERFVKIKKEPVKASLKTMDDSELLKVEAKRIPGQETFYAKANEVKLSKPAA